MNKITVYIVLVLSILIFVPNISFAGNLKITTDPNAVCNNGEQATYTVKAGSTNKWAVILPGGGLAKNANEYKNRPSRMKEPGGEQWFDFGVARDLKKKGYNMVFIPYCTSDLYQGNHYNVIDGKKVPFRGRVIVEDVIRTLYDKLKNADDVIFAGASAGAVGIGFNADLIGQFDNARVLLDSIWFDEETVKWYNNFVKKLAIQGNDRSFTYKSSMKLCNDNYVSCYPSRERFQKNGIDHVFLIWSIGDPYSRAQDKSALKKAIKSDIDYYGAGYSIQADKRNIYGFEGGGHVLAFNDKTYKKKYFKMSLQEAVNNWIDKEGDAIVVDYLENKTEPPAVAEAAQEATEVAQEVAKDPTAEEKRKEEERLAEKKRKKEERLAEEKRLVEEKRIAKEKRIAEEKLKETFKKYNANSQFQKDFVSAILSGDYIKFEDLKFSWNDRLIEIFGLSENDPDHIGNEKLKIEKIEITNLNKNVFYKIIKSVEEKRFDFTLLNEKKWFDEFKFINLSAKDTDFEFNSKTIIFKNFEFKNFEDNIKLVQNSKLNKDEINYISAALSFSLGKIYAENILLDINNIRTIKAEYSDVSNFTLLDWGKWTSKNYSDADFLNNIIVNYTDSYARNIKFDKSEIINFINNFDKNNFDIEKDYSDLLNMFDSLGNTVTNNIVVKDLSAKSKIASLKSFGLKNLNFEYIGDQKQKFLTSLDLNIDGLDLNVQEVSPEFSSYFKLLGYDTVQFDFGTSWNWDQQKNDLGINLDLGITNAASIALSTIFSGLSSEIFNLSGDSLGAYFLTNFKINDVKLSLVDNSLRNKLLNFASQQQNLSVQEFKKTLISQIDSYSATTQKTQPFVEYRKAVVNFINGSRKIKLQISPEMPISIAEMSPYFLNPDINSIISKLNLYVSN